MYLDALEADRQAALSLSEQKAEEAKLIKARQDGFREALEMIGRHIPAADNGSSDHSEEVGQPSARRRARRNIRSLIARELSFSGLAMTTRQLATAIEYTLKLTETALKRMEEDGQVVRDEGDRWAIGATGLAYMNEQSARAGNGESRPLPISSYRD